MQILETKDINLPIHLLTELLGTHEWTGNISCKDDLMAYALYILILFDTKSTMSRVAYIQYNKLFTCIVHTSQVSTCIFSNRALSLHESWESLHFNSAPPPPPPPPSPNPPHNTPHRQV